MSLVATLISNPAAPALDAAAIERARGALPAAQAPVWLDPGIAADIPFTGDIAKPQAHIARALADRVRAALAGAPIDVVVQLASARRKALFLADMDSTMIGQECIDELADYVGLKAARRGHHRARHARRDRVCAGAARAGGAARRACPPRSSTRSSRSGSASRPAPARWLRPCAKTARIPAWSPAASRCSPGASPP